VECFYHEGRTAVGSCRACLKGVCRSCGVDLQRGLACEGRCEQAVRDLMATIDQSVQYRGVSRGILKTARNMWFGLALVAVLVGLFVIVWGLSLPFFREISLLGIPFLILAALVLRVARNSRNSDLSTDADSGSAA
jgi:hypothetical protein